MSRVTAGKTRQEFDAVLTDYRTNGDGVVTVDGVSPEAINWNINVPPEILALIDSSGYKGDLNKWKALSNSFKNTNWIVVKALLESPVNQAYPVQTGAPPPATSSAADATMIDEMERWMTTIMTQLDAAATINAAAQSMAARAVLNDDDKKKYTRLSIWSAFKTKPVAEAVKAIQMLIAFGMTIPSYKKGTAGGDRGKADAIKRLELDAAEVSALDLNIETVMTKLTEYAPTARLEWIPRCWPGVAHKIAAAWLNANIMTSQVTNFTITTHQPLIMRGGAVGRACGVISAFHAGPYTTQTAAATWIPLQAWRELLTAVLFNRQTRNVGVAKPPTYAVYAFESMNGPLSDANRILHAGRAQELCAMMVCLFCLPNTYGVAQSAVMDDETLGSFKQFIGDAAISAVRALATTGAAWDGARQVQASADKAAYDSVFAAIGGWIPIGAQGHQNVFSVSRRAK